MLYQLVRTGQRLAGILPRRVRWWFGEMGAQAAYWGWPAKRLATQKNMSVILGLPRTDPQVRRTARLSWRNYGRFMADFFDLPNHPTAYYFERLHDVSEGGRGALDIIDDIRATGAGGMIASAHYGNWDMAAVLLGSRSPVYAIAGAFGDARTDELIQAQRRSLNLIIIPIADALRPMLRLLRQGEIIATPVDRPVSADEGIPIQFFGKTAYIPRGLGAIVAKVGGYVISGYVWYDGPEKYCARVFEPVRIVKTGDEQADTQRATQAMFDSLEVIVRQDPTQWYMFRQFWPDDEPIDETPAAVTAQQREATHG